MNQDRGNFWSRWNRWYAFYKCQKCSSRMGSKITTKYNQLEYCGICRIYVAPMVQVSHLEHRKTFIERQHWFENNFFWLFDLTLCRYLSRNMFTLVKQLHHPTLPKLCTTSGHRIRKMVKFIIKIIWNATETSIFLKQSKPNKNSVHSTASKKSLVFSSCFFLSIGFFLVKSWANVDLLVL